MAETRTPTATQVEYPLEEAAGRLGITPAALKKRIQRGKTISPATNGLASGMSCWHPTRPRRGRTHPRMRVGTRDRTRPGRGKTRPSCWTALPSSSGRLMLSARPAKRASGSYGASSPAWCNGFPNSQRASRVPTQTATTVSRKTWAASTTSLSNRSGLGGNSGAGNRRLRNAESAMFGRLWRACRRIHRRMTKGHRGEEAA
jgi:hypothetical protein